MKNLIRTLMLATILVAGMAEARTLSQAVDKARRDTGGKVLSAHTEVRGDREVHVIKVLTREGRVKMVRVNGDRRKTDQRRPR